ncbi:MAG: GatB/YqeY domain-containing protein [Neptunomonas phycophila]|uniref:GatB/YqeY domain-containing protein n=1 Tax=Neptunomonas phycophila TaxID=1572645 RepID=UPI003B8C1771
MSLIATIKADQLQARKNKDEVLKPLLTTLLGDAQAVGKNDGNRESTDAEVIATVKSFLKKIKETLDAISDKGGDATVTLQEKAALEAYLPKQLSEEELTAIVSSHVDSHVEDKSMKSMGIVMGHLKSTYDGQYDGQLASNVVRKVLS